MTRWITGVAVVLAASCGAPSRHPAEVHPPGAMGAFVDVLRQGRSLYGISADCTEWRAGPRETARVAEVPRPASSPRPGSSADAGLVGPSARPGAEATWPLRGRLTTPHPDVKGRVYTFTYSLIEDRGGHRLRTAGRGSWHPAPGVEVVDADGWVTATGGSYCVTEVEVHGHPVSRDTIVVGDETWFLSRAACLAARAPLHAGMRGCDGTEDADDDAAFSDPPSRPRGAARRARGQ